MDLNIRNALIMDQIINDAISPDLPIHQMQDLSFFFLPDLLSFFIGILRQALSDRI